VNDARPVGRAPVPPAEIKLAPKHARAIEPLAGNPDADARTVAQHDEVDACSVASFPASDPPSWWGGR
jgi:hypothetical protein